ncbi:MAG TPA: GSU2403 family nucleotidyltransferase fold protein [Rhizobacter sp.]|nr:GSU2403 family nucleotidyltransferase fold protein [Rhizobacter sp.]
MLELAPNVTRQYIDAAASFEAYEEALREAAQVRGGMYWHKGSASNPGADYLVRTSASGGEKSLGARSTETAEIHARFKQRKEEAEARLSGLKKAVETNRRLNRALRVGRVDPLVVDIINRLAEAGLVEHFRIVGTHALYAYEAAAGVRFDAEALATRDIDLLWDVRKRVHFATQLAKVDTSLMNVLKKVDPTFRRRDGRKETAVNKDGFEVDILKRMPIAGDPRPARLSDDLDDFYAVPATNAHVLLDSPAYSAVIVATNGSMARMHTLHPLAFAKFKTWMSGLPDRDSKKRRRDQLQAELVKTLVDEYLPQLANDGVAPR